MGHEIAEYFWRDPASITGYVRERKRFEPILKRWVTCYATGAENSIIKSAPKAYEPEF